jgi:hypothetical protein
MGIIFSEGSGVNDSIFGKCQTPIKIFMEKRAEAFEDSSAIERIFSMQKSKNFAEKATGMTSMHGFTPVGEGGAYPKDEMQEGYSQTFEHETWKDSFAITSEMAEDSVLLNLKKRPAAFLNGFYRTRELFGAALVGAAISGNAAASIGGKNFKTTSNDGLTLFNTGHTSITGECDVQSNKFTNAFSADALGRVESAMQNMKDDNGNILSIAPDTIVIPNDAALKKAVFEAIGADKDPNTSNNGFNYIFGRWNVVVWPYLNQFVGTGVQPWILMASQYNEDYGGALWFDRRELTMKSIIDENTDDNVWKGNARWSAGFNDWRAFAVGGAADGTTLA